MSKLKGKKLVFTGKLSKGRKEMKEEAVAKGASVVSAMSGKVDYLIYGEQVSVNAEDKKYLKAKELGVTVLTETEYRKLF